jgi:hypothetical protein
MCQYLRTCGWRKCLGNVYVMKQDVQLDRTESFARCGCNEIGLRQAAPRWRDAHWCCRCGTATSMRHAGCRCLVLRVLHPARPAEGALPDVLLALMRASDAYVSVSFLIFLRLFPDSTHQYRMSITV